MLRLAALALLATAPAAAQGGDLHAAGRAIVTDFHRVVSPAGVQETFEATLGGARQVVNVRGADRADPLLVKGHGLWAEHTCDAPMEQWTVANETYATALDDPGDALDRAYGVPTALSWDLEWYAVATPVWHHTPAGYEQAGVVHGVVELPDGDGFELREVPAHRWHRWGAALAPVYPRGIAPISRFV